jgi:hypothetical protein
MIAWLIKDSLANSYMSTGQISTMSRGCFASYKVVWDPGDFTIYEQVRESFAWRDFANALSGHMGECTTWQLNKSRHILQAGLIQSSSILGWSVWTDRIIDPLRVQSILIDRPAEPTHFLMISWATWMTELPPWQRPIKSAGTRLTPRIIDYLQTFGQAMVIE